ncbi:unnamed protein product [Adineta steineri]|uniref:UBC core domain-containing protein n=1 Tax=Adineta steineri TaxID=433720 RepID=A0A815SKH5_9BILA|nr:unnamed protein product [Adineta steineri]CAF1641595.1 unnamed protein product [Adineta steineri]
MSTYFRQTTLLEHLPIEIFLEIFASLSLEEIVTAFFDLNAYINWIIRSVKCTNHGIVNNDSKSIDLLKLFPTQIDRLVIEQAASVDFTSLINLRSLTIKHGTPVQLDGIRPQHFPLLEILHIYGVSDVSSVDIVRTINDLFEVILSNGFSRLRICTAAQVGSLESNHKWKRAPTIQYLQLDKTTAHVRDEIYSACPNLRPFKYSLPPISFSLSIFGGYTKSLFREIMVLKQWESKKTFILDFCSMFHDDEDDDEPLPKFSYTPPITRLLDIPNNFVILGRILPSNDPYCFRSFLVRLTFPPSYPFNPPIAHILDPFYHPNVQLDGGHRYYWEYSVNNWSSRITLLHFIEGIIKTIENPDLNHPCDQSIANEYRNNYKEFYDKALKYTLKYGRPRN